MINFHTEVIRHMLEVVDAKQISPLLHQPDQWVKFNEWCGDSSEASGVMDRASDDIQTVCVNRDESMYCVAMSMDTLEGLVKQLVETFEDQELDRFMRAN